MAQIPPQITSQSARGGTRRRFQFRLATLFLLMVVVGVVSAAIGGLVQGRVASRVPREFFVVMLAAAPLGLMILLSVLHAAPRWIRQRRRTNR